MPHGAGQPLPFLSNAYILRRALHGLLALCEHHGRNALTSWQAWEEAMRAQEVPTVTTPHCHSWLLTQKVYTLRWHRKHSTQVSGWHRHLPLSTRKHTELSVLDVYEFGGTLGFTPASIPTSMREPCYSCSGWLQYPQAGTICQLHYNPMGPHRP